MQKFLEIAHALGFKVLCAAAALAKLTAVVGVASASAWSKYQPQIPAALCNRD